MSTLVRTLGIELDTSPIEARLQSFTLRTRCDANRACQRVFERSCSAVVYIDPGTTWRYWTQEAYFTIEVEVFHDAVLIHDIEITRPRDFDLGAFVVWYDGGSYDCYRVPIGDGPMNHLDDLPCREAAARQTVVRLLRQMAAFALASPLHGRSRGKTTRHCARKATMASQMQGICSVDMDDVRPILTSNHGSQDIRLARSTHIVANTMHIDTISACTDPISVIHHSVHASVMEICELSIRDHFIGEMIVHENHHAVTSDSDIGTIMIMALSGDLSMPRTEAALLRMIIRDTLRAYARGVAAGAVARGKHAIARAQQKGAPTLQV